MKYNLSKYWLVKNFSWTVSNNEIVGGYFNVKRSRLVLPGEAEIKRHSRQQKLTGFYIFPWYILKSDHGDKSGCMYVYAAYTSYK